MGCKKYKIQDYFILQNPQNKVDTYTYDHITGRQSLPETAKQKKKPFIAPTDGNKNIIARLHKKREISAKFIYSLFSKLKPSSPAANEVRFKFSSESLDPETELVYYNYRY